MVSKMEETGAMNKEEHTGEAAKARGGSERQGVSGLWKTAGG